MTPQDLKQIGNLFDKRFDSIDKNISELKTDVSSIKSDVKVIKFRLDRNEKAITKINKNILKWKSEMFDSAEVFMKETRDQRESRLIGGYQTTNNTDRIEKLEKTVFGVVSSA